MSQKQCPFFNPANGGNSICKSSCALHTPYGCSFAVLALDTIKKNKAAKPATPTK